MENFYPLKVGSGRFRRSIDAITRDYTVYLALAGILDLPWEPFNPTQLISQGKYSHGKQLWSDDGVALTVEGHAAVRAVICKEWIMLAHVGSYLSYTLQAS